VYIRSTSSNHEATSVIGRIARRMSQCCARGILTTRVSGTRDWSFYGMGAGGLSETFGCGLTHERVFI
jgi:hypothetical protein